MLELRTRGDGDGDDLKCYNLKEPNTFWVFPSKVFKEHARHLKKYNRYRLELKGEGSRKRRDLFGYKDNFYLLEEEAEGPAVAVAAWESQIWMVVA